MNKIKFLVVTALFVCLSSSFALADDELLAQAQELFRPLPDSAPVIEGNPANPDKVTLGRMLFLDPRALQGQRQTRFIRAYRQRSRATEKSQRDINITIKPSRFFLFCSLARR